MQGPILVIGGGLAVGVGPFGSLDSMLESIDPEHVKEHLEECRNGEFEEAPCLFQAYCQGLVSAEQIGSTPEELEEFRQKGVVEPAKRIVEECQAGEFGKIGKLLDWFLAKAVGEDDLSMTMKEIDGLVDQSNTAEARKMVDACRMGDFDQLITLLEGLRRGYFTKEDLDLTAEEIQGFQRQAIREEARKIAEECRNGNFRRLRALERTINVGKLTEDDVADLGIELEKWQQERDGDPVPS